MPDAPRWTRAFALTLALVALAGCSRTAELASLVQAEPKRGQAEAARSARPPVAVATTVGIGY